MNGTLKRLDRVHEKLTAALRTTNPDLLRRRPGENEWSVAEVVQHLCLTEELMIRGLRKSLQRGPAPVGFFKRLIPMSIISSRIMRFQAPEAVRPGDPPPMDELMANYDRLRLELKQLCTDEGGDRLRAIRVKHPVLGYIDGTAAVSLVGFHEERHYKQIREILKKLGS